MLTGIAHLELFFGIDLAVFIGLIAFILFIFAALINTINEQILEKRGNSISFASLDCNSGYCCVDNSCYNTVYMME